MARSADMAGFPSGPSSSLYSYHAMVFSCVMMSALQLHHKLLCQHGMPLPLISLLSIFAENCVYVCVIAFNVYSFTTT